MAISVHLVKAAGRAVKAATKNPNVKKFGKDLSNELLTNNDSPVNAQEIAKKAVSEAQQHEGFGLSFDSDITSADEYLVGPPYTTDHL